MTRHPVPEAQPRIRRQLVDFMSTAEFEALKAAKIPNPLRPKHP